MKINKIILYVQYEPFSQIDYELFCIFNWKRNLTDITLLKLYVHVSKHNAITRAVTVLDFSLPLLLLKPEKVTQIILMKKNGLNVEHFRYHIAIN